MAAVWYRFRAELRSRWAALLALAVLVGVFGGVVLTAAAGARRTDSAYRRYIDQADAWDVLVNPDLGDASALPARYDQLRALPYVEEFGEVVGVSVFPVSGNVEQVEEPLQLAVRDTRTLHEFARPNLLRGRMPDPNRPDEVLVDDHYSSSYGVGPGDRIPSVAVGFPELLAAAGNDFGRVPKVLRSGAIGAPIDLLVTGVGVTPERLVEDEGFAFPSMYLTPAFLEAHPDTRVGFGGGVAQLAGGAADEARFRDAVEALVPEETIEFQSRARVDETVERAVRPYTVALWAFALVVGITGVLVIGQALRRQRVLDALDDPWMQAIGFSRRQLAGLAGLRVTPVAVLGTAIAVAVAVVASPLMPIGPARQAEPDRGISLDLVTLGAGALVCALAVFALGAVAARNLLRATTPASTPRPSMVTTMLGRLGMSPPAANGVRFACESGEGRAAVPARTTLMTSALAVATVIAAFTFAASLDRLLDTPRLYGVRWQLQVELEGESDEDVAAQSHQLESVLAAEPGVEAWSRMSAGRVELDGRSVPAAALDVREGEALATVVAGRLPAGADEVALGARTLERLDVAIGDRLGARHRDDERQLAVVGRVVLPALGNYPGGDKTSPGDGALLTPSGLDRLSPDFPRGTYFVATRPGASGSAVADRLADALDPEAFLIVDPARPADVVDLERVRATPLILAAFLGLLGTATIAHALVTTVRRRRRDLSLLKVLGFSRGQVSQAVAWQASTVALVAVVIGAPLGVVLGRWAWTLLARNVGFVAEPGTAVVALLLCLPVLLVVANAVAAVPAWLAARTNPATVLKAE